MTFLVLKKKKKGWEVTYTEAGATALPGSFFGKKIFDCVFHSHSLVHPFAKICRDWGNETSIRGVQWNYKAAGRGC